MKKTVFLLLCGFFMASSFYAQEKINWMRMDEALEAQAKEPRKIIMDAYTDWCYPCKLMDQETFQNPDVAKYVNENYYAVKFNAEGEGIIHYHDEVYENPNYDPERAGKRNYQHEFAQVLQISAYPTIAFFDETGGYIAPIPGYQTPSQIELFLKMMKTDDYKKIESNEDMKAYQKKFKSTFKD